MVALSIDGLNKVAVELEPDIIYRVGRRLGLEFFIDDEVRSLIASFALHTN